MKNLSSLLNLFIEKIYLPFRFLKHIDSTLTIRNKIFILIGFIISALIIFISTTFAISNNEKKAFDSINLLNNIIHNLYNLVGVEDRYISMDDESYISSYIYVKDELDIAFKRLLSVAGKDTLTQVKIMITLNKKHSDIFSGVVFQKKNIRKLQNSLENEIEIIKKEIFRYVDNINKKEARLNLNGDFIDPVTRTFRDENNKFLLKWIERYSIHQNLNMNSDFKVIEEKREKNLAEINIMKINIKSLALGDFGIRGYSKILKEIQAAQKRALKIEDILVKEFMVARNTLKELSISSKEIKSLSDRIYKTEYINIKKQLEFTTYLINGIISFVLFTVLVISLVLFRSIMGSIFKTIDIVKAISTGDLEIELKLNQKGELAELSQSVNIMIENLRQKAEFAKKVSSGILSQDLKTGGSKDSLGTALLDMAENLSIIISNITNASENLLGNSERITDISRFLKEGSETQLKSLQNIASNVEDIKDMAQNNYSDAKDVNELALSTRDQSKRGYEDLKQMQKSIIEINTSSRDIVKINKVIDDIAFKTQLLSINASIEAARAGKHGKGFSVVATEIRDLAEKSSIAANETNNIIKGTLKTISSGKKTAEDARLSFEEIVKGVSKLSELIDSIVKSSFEQQKGIGDINDGIRLIEQVSIKNAGNSVDADKATDELLKQVDELKEMLSKFRL